MKVRAIMGALCLSILSSEHVSSAEVEACIDMARTGMMVGAQDEICGFGGDLKERLKDAYRAKSCGALVSEEDILVASQEVIAGLRGEYIQSGEETFCREARKSYDEVREGLPDAQASVFAGNVEHVLHMAVFDDRLQPTNIYQSKDECEAKGEEAVAHFQQRFAEKGALSVARQVQYKCEPIIR